MLHGASYFLGYPSIIEIFYREIWNEIHVKTGFILETLNATKYCCCCVVLLLHRKQSFVAYSSVGPSGEVSHVDRSSKGFDVTVLIT